jgi:inorganic pyrophosphatase
MISASGILACILTSFFATHIMVVDDKKKVESTLKWQIIISTIILTPVLIACCLTLLPKEISGLLAEGDDSKVSNVGVMICALAGLWAGLIIGYVTDFYTSSSHFPTKELAQSCKSGAAINIINGLALGYLSCIIPILALAGKFTFKRIFYL